MRRKSLHRTTTTLVTLTIALGVALPVVAENARKYGEVDTATVSAVDAEAQRITIETEGSSQTLVVEPVTRILRGADSIDLKSIDVGDRVVIEARDEIGDGEARLVADRITVVVDQLPKSE